MDISICRAFEKREYADILIIPFFQEEDEKGHPITAFPIEEMKEYYLPPIRAKDFSGKHEEIVWVWGEGVAEKRLLLLGLGKKESFNLEQLRRAYGVVASEAKRKKAQSLTLLLPSSDLFSSFDITSNALTGFFSRNYSFNQFVTDEKVKEKRMSVKKVVLIAEDYTGVEEAAEHTTKVMKGVYLTRDLVNGNADDVTPEYLAARAFDLQKEYPAIHVENYSKEWIEKKGMGLLSAVSRASSKDPQFVTISYKGDPLSEEHTVLVGKAITFDTGGLNLKPVGSIESQKEDMAGAAVVLGALKAAAELSLKMNITGVFAATENAIGSHAYKPGDVYRSLSGKTVEISNTDAEGRLTLADVLYWVVTELAPTRIIDFATLTGAMVVALGGEAAGIMSNSDSLLKELVNAGNKIHERCWRFPLFEEYKEELKSTIADMKSAPTREGGAILAGVFLHEFVGKVPWAHLDIAGVAFCEKAKRYLPKMASGFGVRLMIQYFENLLK